jgi:hypothetical protein
MGRSDFGDLGMRGHGGAFEAAGHQKHRGPEITHLAQMVVPVSADDAIEDWSQSWVDTDFAVEGVYDVVDHAFGDARCDSGTCS